MIALFSKLYSKTCLVSSLSTGKRFFQRFHFRGFTERAQVPLKKPCQRFSIQPFARTACIYVTISGNLEHFQYFNFETDLNNFFIIQLEAVARRCFVEGVFIEVLQNSLENTCAIVLFLIKLQVLMCFLVNFAKFLRTPFPTEHIRWLLPLRKISLLDEFLD